MDYYDITDEQFSRIEAVIREKFYNEDPDAKILTDVFNIPQNPTKEYLESIGKNEKKVVKQAAKKFNQVKTYRVEFSHVAIVYQYTFFKNKKTGNWSYSHKLFKKGKYKAMGNVTFLPLLLGLFSIPGLIAGIIGAGISLGISSVSKGPYDSTFSTVNKSIEKILTK